MVIFHSYVKLPEGIRPHKWNQDILNEQSAERRILSLNLCFCCCKSQLRPGLALKTSNVGYQVSIEHMKSWDGQLMLSAHCSNVNTSISYQEKDN